MCGSLVRNCFFYSASNLVMLLKYVHVCNRIIFVAARN